MKPSEVLILAASLVGGPRWCCSACWAIAKAVAPEWFKEDGTNLYVLGRYQRKTAYRAAWRYFKVFEPPCGGGGFWWDDSKRGNAARVNALCMAAAMAKAEGR